MLALASELANPAQTSEGRAQAGLQLKQCLTSKDEALKEAYAGNWLTLPDETRANIKGAVCTTLIVSGKESLMVVVLVGALHAGHRAWRPVDCCPGDRCHRYH